jgi:hypothetical protein
MVTRPARGRLVTLRRFTGWLWWHLKPTEE